MGPTYIVVDGVDEIDEHERRDLLCTLLELYKDCENLKLLISSRREDDISRILRAEAQSVHIDRKNAGEIQTYLTQRCDTWLSEHDFDLETASEIKRLLRPISFKAEGNFLFKIYAACLTLWLIRE